MRSRCCSNRLRRAIFSQRLMQPLPERPRPSHRLLGQRATGFVRRSHATTRQLTTRFVGGLARGHAQERTVPRACPADSAPEHDRCVAASRDRCSGVITAAASPVRSSARSTSHEAFPAGPQVFPADAAPTTRIHLRRGIGISIGVGRLSVVTLEKQGKRAETHDAFTVALAADPLPVSAKDALQRVSK